jgi:hypothetical protein
VNVTHYHVTERIGKTERVVATFASAFQAADDDRRDAGRRDAPPRPIISYMACCCTTETVPHPG